MKNCIICNKPNDTNNNSCSKCWSLNGISWAYIEKLSEPCPRCQKSELRGGGFDTLYKCDNCGYMTSEGLLWQRSKGLIK